MFFNAYLLSLSKDFLRCLCGVDLLLLEVDADSQHPQLPQGFKALAGVPAESGHRFAEDPVDSAPPAVPQHPLELLPDIHAGAGQALVRVDIRQLPFRILLNILGVVRDLSLVACFLFFGIRADAAVGCNTEFFLR